MDTSRLNNAFNTLKVSEQHDHHYAAEIDKLKEAKEQLLDRLQEFEERKQNSAAVSDGSEYVRDDDVVEINAGGRIIAARRSTLSQLKGTRLEALFSGRWDKKLCRDSNGRIFLDVNGDCFQAIVDFLNEMTISSEEHPSEPPSMDDAGDKQVLAQYLELFGLRIPPVIPDSNIITQYSQVKLLHKWLSEEDNANSCSMSDGTSDVELSLIYHASKENFQYGPAFGGGCAQCDLKVTGSRVYLNTGHIYECGKSEKLTDGHSYTINEMEVFRVSYVSGAHHTHQHQRQLRKPAKRKQVKRFTKEINRAINEKWAALRELEAELCSLEESFDDEELFINAFASGEGKDIVTLNVSGTIMITKRSTLQVTEDSVLAHQFDDTKWTEQGCSNLRVKEWSPDEVSNWVANIAHIPDDVAGLFIMHEVNGSELIALNEYGLEKIGVKRAGTICLLLDEISSLKKTASEDRVTLIEHSPYCFGKILDSLRLKRLHDEDFIDEPPLPSVSDDQMNRFKKIVRYYFPGEISAYILGLGRHCN
eukprot:scaffold11801_cov145-Skeletonema_menzelii.AAC.1